MIALRDEQIGGGVVAKAYRSGGKAIPAGTKLTAEQILGMPRTNRRAMIDAGYINVYPKDDASASRVNVAGERFLVGRRGPGGGYDVIEGRRINDGPLSKEAAMALVGN